MSPMTFAEMAQLIDKLATMMDISSTYGVTMRTVQGWKARWPELFEKHEKRIVRGAMTYYGYDKKLIGELDNLFLKLSDEKEKKKKANRALAKEKREKGPRKTKKQKK